MRLGISLPTVTPAPEREVILQVAVGAERLGFHSVWTTDHVAIPAGRTSLYPYPWSTTELAFSPGVQWLDPVAVMGFVAGATTRIAVGTSVLVLPYRHPLVLANEVASVDQLAGAGRTMLGIGVGWMDEEFEALGIPKAERATRTDEAVRAMRTLWTSADRPCRFEGRFWRFHDLHLATAPATPGGPSIYVGGNEEPALRRAVALGDGWLGFEVFPEDMPRVNATIDQLGERMARDPTSLLLSVRRGLRPPFEISDFLPERRCLGGSADGVVDELRRYEEHGVTLLVLDLAMTVPEMLATMEWLAQEVTPALA